MKFHEKLDFLMNITGTNNSALAQAAFLDASYISRLRRGERKPAENAAYIKNIAAYLTRQCTKEYQKKALLEAMQGSAGITLNTEINEKTVYSWLLDSNSKDTIAVAQLLDGMAKVQFKKTAFQDLAPITNSPVNRSDVSLYYGNQGKREAVLQFLTAVLESPLITTLLLYSDEQMDWLTEDMAFQAKWAHLMSGIIKQGHRIKMIHTISRNLDEMLEGLAKWMPLYMTGSIEPFYYPRKRDEVFKRTLFVAPGIMAVSSSSISNMQNYAVNIMLKNSRAIEALAEEYNSYLQLCKPLMKSFTPNERLAFLSTINEFEKEPSDAIVKAGFLSLLTMPASVAENMLNRMAEPEKNELLKYFCQRQENFVKSLSDNHFLEIIQLPDIKDIKAGKIAVGFAGFQTTPKVCYHPDEYRLHLENIVDLLQRYDNYQFYINNEKRHYEYRLYAKEDLGVIITKTTPPYVVFAINESNMTAAFWDYLTISSNANQSNKKTIIAKLQKMINSLK